ncbi:MAG: T9SS type A sorting domain-containing protein [Bacteroidetes bacterium]|nr:T9SS type A sorting domain-containing protein [Bacteroidota bacterium]
MKKTLLFAALLIGGLSQLSAQCTIIPGCTLGSTGYCTTPAENTSLPNGTELVPYSTVIQLSLGTNVGGFVTITDATISGVIGSPSGFTYSVNPVGGTFVGGSDACLILSGTPSLGSAGTYTVGLGFDVNTSFGPTTQTLNFGLQIDPSGTTNVKSITASSNFVIAPNPATNELFVASASHFGKVVIIDALGKTVLSHDANYAAQTTINISSLSKGVYFLQVSDGTNLTTKKFIKD